MKTKNKTLLDAAIEEKQASINKDFLKEWQPFDKMSKKVERAILNHFMKHTYTWQPTHEESSKRPFKPFTFNQIDEKLGFAYTSTGAYAGYWVCNGGYMWADPTHHFIGFAINTDGEVIGIADDYDENEIYIKL
jgi:hypothetical protein